MLPMSKVKEYWAEQLGLARASEGKPAKQQIKKSKKKRVKKHLEQKKLRTKAVRQQQKKRQQLKTLESK